MKKILSVVIISMTIFVAGSQTAEKVFKTAASAVGKLKKFYIAGTWVYEGVDIQFTSGSLLKKAGGTVAAHKLGSQLDRQLAAAGIVEGVTIFEFSDDGTFSTSTGGRNIHGSYTLDKNSGVIVLRYIGLIPVKANIKTYTDSFSLLYEADAFLSVISFIGENSGSGIIESAGKLIGSYDGMLAGMKFRKSVR